jgi:hypothetical protein
MNTRGSGGDSYYNGLTVGVRSANFRRLGLQFNANYTYAHTIDNLSATFSDELQNLNLGFLDPFNPALDKGNADYDIRHQVNVSMVWELPFFRNSQSAFWRNLLGGFQFAPIFRAHTGTPFTLFDCANEIDATVCARYIPSGSLSFQGTTSGQADLGGNVFNYLTVPTPVSYADPVFGAGELPTCTGPLGQGCQFPAAMSHRNAFRGPGRWMWDLGVYKNFKITERFTMQLRGEFFNILNHHNFYMLQGSQMDVSSSSYICPVAGLTLATCTSPLQAASPFTAQMKKGGLALGYPYAPDERRNTQLAVKFIF